MESALSEIERAARALSPEDRLRLVRRLLRGLNCSTPRGAPVALPPQGRDAGGPAAWTAELLKRV